MDLDLKLDLLYSFVTWNDLWALYKESLKTLWVVSEDFDTSLDGFNYAQLRETEKSLLSMALILLLPACMGESAIIRTVGAQTVSLEVQGFLRMQSFSENIHAEIVCRYVHDIVDVDMPDDDQIILSRVFTQSRGFQRMKEWNAKWISECNSGHVTLGEGILALAVSRGLLRCSIRAVLACPDLTGDLERLDNIMTVIGCANDSYVQFACLLYGRLDARLPWTRVISIIREAVIVEKDIVYELLPLSGIGIAVASMLEYIEFKADGILRMLGFQPYFHANNPFGFVSRTVQKCIEFDRYSEDHHGLFKVVRCSYDEDGMLTLSSGVFPYR